MADVLLFGASGMFGTAFERIYAERKGTLAALTHADIDITKPDQLQAAMEKHAPQVVINAVALVGINPCEQYPVESFDLHSAAVSHIAKLAAKAECTFVQLSTHAVFDGRKDGFYTESDTPRGTNIYAASKIAGEQLAENICSKHYIVRLPTMFGSRRNNRPGFADKALGMIKEGKEVRIATDKLDSPSYTVDLARALLEILDQRRPYGTYHLANAGNVSLFDFTKELVRLLGMEAKMVPAKDADFPGLAYKPLKTAMSSEKLPPLRSWKDALKDHVENDLGVKI